MAEGEGNGRTVAIGCCAAVAVVVIAGIMVAVMFAPKIVDKVKGAFQSQEQLAEAMQIWDRTMLDAGVDAEVVSPVAFAGFTRDRQSKDTKPRGLDLGKVGHLAEYSNGAKTVSVWTSKASNLEQEAMQERLKSQNEERFSLRSSGSITTGNVTAVNYSGSPPKERGVMALSGDWVVFLQTNDPDLDLNDLLKDYVTEVADVAAASGGEGAAEVEAKGSAEVESGGAEVPALDASDPAK